MKRVLVGISALALMLATASSAELHLKTLSVTATSQTYLFPAPADGVTLCNQGANAAYYRLFWDGEVTSAATTSNHILPPGTSASAPYCVGIPRPATIPAAWRNLSIVCDTGETATVTVEPL